MNEYVSPGARSPESNVPLSEVAECVIVCLFVHVTVSPTETVKVEGVNSMVMSTAFAGAAGVEVDESPPLSVVVSPVQPARTGANSSRHSSMVKERMKGHFRECTINHLGRKGVEAGFSISHQGFQLR